ncbi:hypothetical protein [Providencia phage Kokobel2]|nr:hypothetical protein [Providencia phage Kokobel2]
MSRLDRTIFNKKTLVKLPEVDDGIVAFQMVEYVIDFFGNEISNTLDTKIMEDGRQIVIDGDGFIPAGTEIPQ